MENTTPLLFDDKEKKYFVLLQNKASGPFTSQGIYQKIFSGEMNLGHFLWKEEWKDWKRVIDEEEFSTLVQQKPKADVIDKIKEKISAKRQAKLSERQKKEEELAASTRNYYLYYSSAQYGPFSKDELVQVLETKNVGKNAYVWMPGWANWKRLSEMSEFSRFLKVTPTPPGAPLGTQSSQKSQDSKDSNDSKDKRGAPRRPLVARIFVHNDEEVAIAVCRDISIGGMQVLTDKIPGKVGSIIKLNVSPGDGSKVKSFVAEGVVVRHLEDGRGFSFRFSKLSSDTKKMIMDYISDGK